VNPATHHLVVSQAIQHRLVSLGLVMLNQVTNQANQGHQLLNQAIHCLVNLVTHHPVVNQAMQHRPVFSQSIQLLVVNLDFILSLVAILLLVSQWRRMDILVVSCCICCYNNDSVSDNEYDNS